MKNHKIINIDEHLRKKVRSLRSFEELVKNKDFNSLVCILLVFADSQKYVHLILSKTFSMKHFCF